MKSIHKNKKAYFDYEILEELTAGIILTGPEVKSVRAGNVNLKGSYISVYEDEAQLKNTHISKYPYDNSQKHDPFRNKKLLLKKKELDKLLRGLNTQGSTIIPLEIGLEGKYIKIRIALVRGKKKHDKRHTIKERDLKKRIDRLIKNYR